VLDCEASEIARNNDRAAPRYPLYSVLDFDGGSAGGIVSCDVARLRASALVLSFAQSLLLIFDKRRKQIADNTTGSGFDFHGDGHARGKVREGIFDLNLRAIE